jgi:small subunit ribosomal protein S2
MSHITMKEMLVAGMHFGHQTHRWNPKMKPFIFGARNKIYIINLDKTLPLFNKAYDFIEDQIAKGGNMIFVCTKQQGQEIIKEEAQRCGMYFINKRWLGGMLTNFQTIRKSIDRLKLIEGMIADGSIHKYKKKEALGMEKELGKLERNLGGIKDMRSLPSILFVVDPKRERISINEANRMGIPVVALVDTNCDPEGIDHLIPGNDDALRSIRLITSKIADAVLAGKSRRRESAAEEVEAAMLAQEEAAQAAAEAEEPAPEGQETQA